MAFCLVQPQIDLWKTPPTVLELTHEDVHIWLASVDQPDTNLEQFAQILSDDELLRARRFHFDRDRKRFVVGHGVLRMILGTYKGLDPKELQFDIGAYGKPNLAMEANDDSLMYNMSYSRELVLYGFARDRRIGVDLEYIHAMPDFEAVAGRFFSTSENEALHSLPGDKKLMAFFRCWTRKEAFVKALGEGLSDSLNQFDVSLVPWEGARLLEVRCNSQKASDWSLEGLTPNPGYAAAVAVEGSDNVISHFQWQ